MNEEAAVTRVICVLKLKSTTTTSGVAYTARDLFY
jgi:hypothetical protein